MNKTADKEEVQSPQTTAPFIQMETTLGVNAFTMQGTLIGLMKTEDISPPEATTEAMTMQEKSLWRSQKQHHQQQSLSMNYAKHTCI